MTPTYRTWQAMLSRVRNPRYAKWYVGVGVCDRWLKFDNFLEDMGERPTGKTLDRFPDRTGNYEPGNCRWATWSEQNYNRKPMPNRSTGVVGVYPNKSGNFRVFVNRNAKQIYVGTYPTVEQAAAVRHSMEFQ